MQESNNQSTGGKLRREISLIALIAMIIGLNIGGSLFALTAISAGLTGPSLFIAQLISALPILLAIVPYLTLTSAIPTTCANYQYAKLFSYPLAVAAWMVLFIAIPVGMLPLFGIITGNFILNLAPGLPIDITTIAIITMLLFYLINVLGVKPAAYIQLVAVAILLIALFIFIFPGIPAIETHNLTPLFTGGAMGLIGASALLFTLLAGGLFGIELGDEIKNARSTIPKALIISMSIVIVIYLLIEIVAVGAIDWKVFAEEESLVAPARVFLSSPLLNFFIIGGGILAAITTINITYTAAGRYALAFARDRFFPGFFGNISKRFGTPHWGLTLVVVLSVITLLINPPLKVLGSMLNFGLLFMITLVLFGAYKLPEKHPAIYQNSKFKFSPKILKITSLSAASINIIFMIVLAIGMMTSEDSQWTFPLFVIAAVIGLILYYIKKRRTGIIPLNIKLDQME